MREENDLPEPGPRIPNPEPRIPEAALMTAYQAGSMPAFEHLYARLAPPLLSYLTSLSRDRTRAQDLLQEAFLQIHRSRHAYRPDLPVRPWVFTIARNQLLDILARRKKVRSGSSSVIDLLNSKSASSDAA